MERESFEETDVAGESDGSFQAADAGDRPRGERLAGWLGIAASLLATVSCMLNGVSAWAVCLPVLFAGVTLLLCPPRRQLPLIPLGAALTVIAAGCIGLMPSTLQGSLPEWRLRLIENWDFVLPNTISPQPALTWGSLGILFAMIGWFFAVTGLTLGTQARRSSLRVLCLGIVTVAALGIADRFELIDLGWPLDMTVRSGEDLGPFPNRNHFSGLSAIGCVLCAALALDAYRNKSALWALFAVGLTIPFSAIVINTSRAGLILFFLGITAWLATASMRKGFFRKLSVTAAVVLGAASVLLIFGGGAGAKLVDKGVVGQVQNVSGRLDIYGEAATLAMKSPWTGIGLGNFDSVFSLNHQLRQSMARFIHPESDWLWWWVEAGLLGVLPVLAVLVWLLGASGPWLTDRSDSRNRRQDRRLRNAAAIGLALALFHALVDVPMHNVGFASVALLLAGLAVAPKSSREPASELYRLGFRLLGLAILGIGIALVFTAMGSPSYPGRLGLRAEKDNVNELIRSNQQQLALDRLNALITEFPLQWDLHFQRGALRLSLHQDSAAALMDFSRARVLEPNNAPLCFEEGKIWLTHDPSQAILPWREYFERQQNMEYYGLMLSLARPHPELWSDLRKLASTPAMKLTFLVQAYRGPEWDEGLDQLLAQDPGLLTFNPAERSRLFATWRANGDKERLIAAVEANPEWRRDAWNILAEEYALRSDFQRAWETQKQYAMGTSPGNPPTAASLEQLERNFVYNPTDLRHGVDLFLAQKAQGKTQEAMRTLIRLLELPGAPPYLLQEKAELHADEGDYRRAYETMREAIQQRK